MTVINTLGSCVQNVCACVFCFALLLTTDWVAVYRMCARVCFVLHCYWQLTLFLGIEAHFYVQYSELNKVIRNLYFCMKNFVDSVVYRGC